MGIRQEANRHSHPLGRWMERDGHRSISNSLHDAMTQSGTNASLPGRPRRVAFIGNVANSHFRAALALRSASIDAHLFVSRTDTSRPEHEVTIYEGNYPNWIHAGEWITPIALAAPWRAPVTKLLTRYDAVVASGPGPIFAQFADVPWSFYVTGADLTIKPFPWTFRYWYPSWPHRGAELIAGAWQRRALRRAPTMWTQPFAPLVDAARRIGIPSGASTDAYIPITLDLDRFQPNRSGTPAAAMYAAHAADAAELIVFHPSRLVMDRSEAMVRTGQWKGNDRLLRGFARFVHAAPNNALLWLIDSPMSKEIAEARALIDKLGIGEHVRWLRPPNGRRFDHDHMHALYQRADIVADEFGVGWFGYVALEGLAMERPVVSHVDEGVMRQLYPDSASPIRSAATSSDIAAELEWLNADVERRRAVGAAGRAWVSRQHSPEATSLRYVAAVNGLLATRGDESVQRAQIGPADG